MQTVKQIVQDIVDHLPEQATLDDAMYRLYVRQKLEHALQAAEQGQVTSHAIDIDLGHHADALRDRGITAGGDFGVQHGASPW